MHCDEQTRRALHALQAALVSARQKAFEAGEKELALFLDDVENLPYLIARGDRRVLREALTEMAERWVDQRLLSRLQEDPPEDWRAKSSSGAPDG